MKTFPLVDLIIVTYNSEKYINKCLGSVFKESGSFKQLIIFDNNSTDKTRSILIKYQKRIKLICSNKNIGYAGGVNEALKVCKSKYFFILNPDTEVSKNFLNPMLKVMEGDKKIGACQPAVYLLTKKSTLNLTGKETHYLGFDWIRDYKAKVLPLIGEITSFSGSGVLIRTSLFNKLGGYDPFYFMYYEDSDLSWRMRLAGYKIVFVPESVIFHDYKFKTDEKYQPMKQKLYYLERNRLITIFKNYEIKSLILILPLIFLTEVLMLVYSLSKGFIRHKIMGYLNIVINLDLILESRKRTQGLRRTKDSTVTSNFKSVLSFSELNTRAVRIFVNPVLNLYLSIIRKFI